MPQQGLFIRDTNGESGGKKLKYWLVKYFPVEVDVDNREHRRQHQVTRLS